MRAAFAKRVGPTDRKKLIAGIHAQASALHLDDDTRRDMQQQLVGVESTKEMSVSQLSTIWHRLTVLAKDAGLARPRRKSRPGRDERQPAEPPTTEQLDKIAHLYEHLGVHGTDAIALCRRMTRAVDKRDGFPWPQTREQANKVIEGLKAMEKRGWRARGAGITEPSPCSLPAHNQNVLGQCAQSETVSALPADGEKEEGKNEIPGRQAVEDTVHESPLTP